VHCLAAASRFLLSQTEAKTIIDDQIGAITDGWKAVCEEAKLSAVDRDFLWKRQFLSDYALEGLG